MSRRHRTVASALLLVGLTAVLVSLIQIASAANGTGTYLAIGIAGMVAVAAALLMLSKANRVHPHITKYAVVSLHPAEIKRAADEGKPFPLPLGTRTVNVLVGPDTSFEQGEIIEVEESGETVRRPIGKSVAYAGTVVGAEGRNDVRLTITEDWLTGYVLERTGWWFIEPLRRFRVEAGLDEYLVYRTKDLRFRMNVGDDTVPKMVEQFSPDSPPDGAAYLPAEPTFPSPPTVHKVGPCIGIALVADSEFETQAKWTGTPWYVQQIGVLNNVNGLYKGNLGCWFFPKVCMLNRTKLTDCQAGVLLKQLDGLVKTSLYNLRLVAIREGTGTEVAHLTSGKNLAGSTLGIAWQPGVYSLSQQQLVWIGGGGGFGGPPNLAFQNMMLMAHEVGHSFDGEHAEADEWCVTKFLWWCVDYERSLMWPTFHDDNNPWISDGSHNPTHNNRQRMKDDMATGRNQNL